MTEPKTTEIKRFWRHLFGGESGQLMVWTAKRVDDHLPKETVVSRNFSFPDKAEDAAIYGLEKASEGREVYFAAHLLSGPRRIKANAAPVRALWGDLDGVEVPNGELKPTAVVESSPGRYHCYWRLDSAIPPETAEKLNQRLAAKIDADSSGFDLTQLLRVPGTVNCKYPGTPEVKLGTLDGTRSYSATALDKILPASEKKPGAGSRAPTRTTTVAAGEKIPQGCRNDELTKHAGRLHNGKRSLSELTADLLRINAGLCTPPLPEEEVRGIARSIYKKPPCKPTREVKPEVLELCAVLEQRARSRECKSVAARSRWAVYRALIDLARTVGRKVRSGVAISISIRKLALLAGVSKATLTSALDKLQESGLVRRSDSGRGTKAGSLVLVTPVKAESQPTHPESVSTSSGLSLCPNSLSDVLYKLRWGAGRVGKIRAALLEVLLPGGVWSRKALAEAIGRKPETIRAHLQSLVSRDLVVRVSRGRYQLPEDFAEVLHRETVSDRAAEARDRDRFKREHDAYVRVIAERKAAREAPVEVPEEVPQEVPEPVAGHVEELKRVSETVAWPDPYHGSPPSREWLSHHLGCGCLECSSPPPSYAAPPGARKSVEVLEELPRPSRRLAA